MSTTVDWQNEISFWDKELSGKGMYSADTLTRFDLSQPSWEYPAPLEPILERLGREKGRRARVADLGSGPASVLAYGHGKKLFDLVAIDPLADEYMMLIERHGLTPVSPMVALAGENLLDKFESEFFDLVWSFNSIDHCQNPQELFDSVVEVTSPGGIILIQCWNNEGSEAGWSGLHKYDFSKSPEGGMLCTTEQGVVTALGSERVRLLPSDFITFPNQPKAEHRDWLVFAYERL